MLEQLVYLLSLDTVSAIHLTLCSILMVLCILAAFNCFKVAAVWCLILIFCFTFWMAVIAYCFGDTSAYTYTAVEVILMLLAAYYIHDGDTEN